MENDATLEAAIATLRAKIQASSLTRHQKEPYDTPQAMVPVAYAMFEVLVDAGSGSGLESEWAQFLRGALAECIAMSAFKKGASDA